MKARSLVIALTCILPIFAFGLDSALAATASAPAAQDPLLAQLTGAKNACHEYPWLVTAGQPNADALATLANAGFHDVYDLRGAEEARGIDEAAVARSLSMHYIPIPTTKSDFTDARFTAFRHHLIAHGDQEPMFIHCGSGNRVGAALLPWLVLDQGLPQDRALEMAHTMGLTDPALEKRALEYIQTHWRAKP